MGDLLDDKREIKNVKKNTVLYILSGLMLYIVVDHLMSFSSYLHELSIFFEDSPLLYFWFVTSLKAAIGIVMANFVLGKIMRQKTVSFDRSVLPLLITYIVIFILLWVFREYYEEIFGERNLIFYKYWDTVYDEYDVYLVNRVFDLVVLASVIAIFLRKASKTWD